MNITKPIAPDTLIERLRSRTVIQQGETIMIDMGDGPKPCSTGDIVQVRNPDGEEAAATLEANNRQLQLCRDIADKVLRQAECLEGYAVQAGFEAGPVPSVFHLQASHFRTYANELRASIEGVGE